MLGGIVWLLVGRRSVDRYAQEPPGYVNPNWLHDDGLNWPSALIIRWQ